VTTILVATDKFKGSLSAGAVCDAVREGILSKHKNVRITTLPLADGGEGTLELLTHYYPLEIIRKKVTGPLFEPVVAEYGFYREHKTAFIETAKACGLHLVPAAKRNPLQTTTIGVGQLILDALDRGAEQFIITIGGTATTDAGIGLASALGYQFNDSKREPLRPIGANLPLLYNIECDKADPRLRSATFVALCDVMNPFHGTLGAAHRFAAQKGATPDGVRVLDNGLVNFEKVVRKSLLKDANGPGCGAGGGIGSGCKVFLNAELVKGMDYIKDMVRLYDAIKQSDIVVTGEGSVDQDSFSGKVVGEVVRYAGELGKRIVLVCGVTAFTGNQLNHYGVERVITLADSREDVPSAMQYARSRIVNKIASLLEL
jgi:glycerate 2-kinase